MRLLLLGGTQFVGRHLVAAALARGHDITLFNRGQRNPGLFPQVENLQGDRDGGLSVLHGRTWDVVIDTCGYVPRLVRASAELLANSVERYVFISSLSVYADSLTPHQDESGPLGTLTPEQQGTETVDGATYGPLKVLCEQAAESALPERTLIIRPGLIVGPYDPTNRFTYWPARIARGGEVLAPDAPERLTQFIDARDLAAWTLNLAEAQATGIYNATGPDYPLTLGTLFEACKTVTNSNATFTWVRDEFLLAQNVGVFMELPLWLPRTEERFGTINCAKAFRAGLTLRPLADTIRDTWAWDQTLPIDAPRRAGLTPEREGELLQAWQKEVISNQ